jgi:thymidylate synthase (FAD)
MKIIYSPSVYVVGRQTLAEDGLSEFLSDHGVTWSSDSEVPAEVLTETAGRICYLSFAAPRPGGNAAYLGHIKEVGHGSVLEHSVWNIIVTGVSRSLTHELVRHRVGVSPSQLSQRYVDESVAEYVCPPDLREEIEAAKVRLKEDWGEKECYEFEFNETLDWPNLTDKERAGLWWLRSMSRSHQDYVYLAHYLTEKANKKNAESKLTKTESRKFARQAARSVLPNATETKVFLTINGRAARHLLSLRGSRHADPEIRILATAIFDALRLESPNLFGDFVKEPLPDGTFELKTPYEKC